jgi:hypothetical protein
MQAIYKNAIKTGIIGGIAVVALLAIIDVLVLFYLLFIVNNLSIIEDQFPILIYLPVLACIIAMAGVGVFAVRRASAGSTSDVAILSLLAGAVASIVASLANVVVTIITTYCAVNILFSGPGISGLSPDTTLMAGSSTFCCCMPVSIVMGTVVALIGGMMYARMRPQKTSPPDP